MVVVFGEGVGRGGVFVVAGLFVGGLGRGWFCLGGGAWCAARCFWVHLP